jgi:hypothetical protein
VSHCLFGWLVADGWCWFVLREEHCWLVAGGWFVVRAKHCWLVADKPSEQGTTRSNMHRRFSWFVPCISSTSFFKKNVAETLIGMRKKSPFIFIYGTLLDIINFM